MAYSTSSNSTNSMTNRASQYAQGSYNNNNDAAGANSNFHVCVRMRPTSSPSFENSGAIAGNKYIRAGPENSILFVQPNSTQGDKVFIYDEVFDSKTQTYEIFEKVVKPNLSDSLFKGFSHTVLVYGMTGSGKTFTMFGNNGEISTPANAGSTQGVVQRDSQNQEQVGGEPEVDGPLRRTELESASANNEVELDSQAQQQLQQERKGGLVSQTVNMVLTNSQQLSSKTRIKMSYLEIYNEQIRDLLSTELATAENLMILEDPDKGVYCPLLSEKEINSIEQIQQLIKQGNRRRVMASTKLNEFSSRSHAIIQLSIEIEVEHTTRVTTFLTPKLYLVDLAGSERASATESKGVRLKEGANINKSLLSLGNCITVLSQPGEKNKKHVPYRDSKLTRLLKESLGGNAKTLLIACVTPAFRFVEETINTLKYAQRAKSIHKDVYENMKQIYNKIEKTEQLQQQQLLQENLQSEIDNLKGLLASGQEGSADILDSIQDANLTEEEKVKRSQMQQGGADGDLRSEVEIQQQLLLQQQYEKELELARVPVKSAQEIFRESFASLSEQFEEILFLGQELEFNLLEHNQSRESNEKLVHEIMDTINPAALSQKEMKLRVDKVNLLRSIIKSNEDAIEKLHREVGVNEANKVRVKFELAKLYEVKFVQECLSLNNFHLYNSFELEKKRLRAEIIHLTQEKQSHRGEDDKKDAQIRNLREEIEYIKMKTNQTQALLNQQIEIQEQQRSRKRSKKSKCQINLRNSMYQPNNKATPRNASAAAPAPNQVQSKYMQVQTFVPSTSISATVVRDRSQNLRQSMYSATQSKAAVAAAAAGGFGIKPSQASTTNIDCDQFENRGNYGGGVKSMTDVHFNFDRNAPDCSSPSTREYEDFKRKERIIEMQLGSQQARNLRQSRVFPENSSNNNNNSQNTHTTATATTVGSINSTHFTQPNKNSQQQPLYKSSFKSSFIDLVPEAHANSHSTTSNGNYSNGNNNNNNNPNASNLLTSYSDNQNKSYDELISEMPLCRSDLVSAQANPSKQSKDTDSNSNYSSNELVKRSSFNLYELQSKNATPTTTTGSTLTSGTGSTAIAAVHLVSPPHNPNTVQLHPQTQFSSPKSENKVKISIQNQHYLQNNNAGGGTFGSAGSQICPSTTSKSIAKHSKNPSQQSLDERNSNGSSSNGGSSTTGGGLISGQKNYSPIIESQFDQSAFNSPAAFSYQNNYINHANFSLENSNNSNGNSSSSSSSLNQFNSPSTSSFNNRNSNKTVMRSVGESTFKNYLANSGNMNSTSAAASASASAGNRSSSALKGATMNPAVRQKSPSGMSAIATTMMTKSQQRASGGSSLSRAHSNNGRNSSDLFSSHHSRISSNNASNKNSPNLAKSSHSHSSASGSTGNLKSGSLGGSKYFTVVDTSHHLSSNAGGDHGIKNSNHSHQQSTTVKVPTAAISLNFSMK